MRLLGPTNFRRLNEAAGIVFLLAGLLLALSLVSYHPLDPSWNTATSMVRPHNWIGRFGSCISDLCFQAIGLAAFAIPVLAVALGWKWLRSHAISDSTVRVLGAALLISSVCAGLALAVPWRPWGGEVGSGGVWGALLADTLMGAVNAMGAMLITGVCIVLSLYLVSTFSVSMLRSWFAWPLAKLVRLQERWKISSQKRQAAAAARNAEKLARREEERVRRLAERQARRGQTEPVAAAAAQPKRRQRSQPEEAIAAVEAADPAPWEEPVDNGLGEIPIHVLEDERPVQTPAPVPVPAPPEPVRTRAAESAAPPKHADYRLPPTSLLNEIPARNPFDSEELKEIAAKIKSKFEEFGVRGSVVQINPGPVVTTFEFKPEAGIKLTKITSLAEDLCLGLQAESILIERIPGKPTVGIEVPNSRREVISLRQILESEEFDSSPSRMTISLGKDINGRIKVGALESMPHLLIAGSTGAGKSVMLNAMIMSILYKATPDEVRLIMVDPKRVELGIYEGIPHLLTPVITDSKKATYALKNAVLEMERRLKLLASHGVRNIDQFNKKVRQIQNQPRSLFEEDDAPAEEELRPLPYILILIDELADLMMLERANVEESVTRLAQMARAVGMHLVLATQRPSVDVITGLIKANFPARISFRVATRVDSRTVLDVMGAEHLLGKGDMLMLPPGSSRLTRVHGAFVTEAETNSVVEFWKEQARPEYDQTFLMAPPSDEGEEEAEEFEGSEDPLYQDAVRVVLEMGKASTSTLQRRLRLGYGRAARILDMMQRDGIIGPPDGSKPREVLKRPDWLQEVGSGAR
jgi:S-DNA-T family DNA segregation ATPase FtsK/SpoIIIE